MRRVATGVLIFLLLQACAQNPDTAKRSLLTRGERFFTGGNYADAEIQFRKALQADARFGDGWYWLGRTEERLGNYTPAFEAFKQAVALMPDQDAPKIALGNFLLIAYLGNPAHPAGTHERISKLSSELLASHPDSFDGLRLLAYLTLSDKNPDSAAEYFEKLNQLKPGQADIATALCASLMQAGKKERAERTALDLLKKIPTAGPLYTMLYEYYLESGRAEDAEKILQAKVTHNPKESLYRIELARHYARRGRTAESAEVLRQIVLNRADFPRGQLEVGDFYRDSHDWAAARQHYAEGAQSDHKSRVTYWKRLAQLDLAVNDTSAAMKILDQILMAQPGDPESMASRASLRMASSDPAQKKLAISEFKLLTDASPERNDYRYQYADALRVDGQEDAARGQLLVVVGKEPANLPALQTLADLSIRGRRLEDALVYSGRILALQPGDPRAILVQSAALAAQGRLAETHSLLTQLAKQHPEIREAHLQLALVDIEQKHYSEAEARLRKLYSPGKADIQSLKGLVELYRAEKQLDRAVALLQQDLDKEPQSADVRILLARTAAQAGNREVAIPEYEKLARTQNQSPEIAVEIGLERQSRGDFAGAIAQFEHARALAPSSSLVYAYIGKARQEQGRSADAVENYRKSLSLEGHNPWVMNNLAYLLADTGGDLREAMTLAQNAARFDPANASFSDTVGWIYLKKNDFPSAIHVFTALLDKTPGDVGLRIHLSQAFLGAGDRAQAKTQLETARGLSPTPVEMDAIGKLLDQVYKR